jgi:hypothetical protein
VKRCIVNVATGPYEPRQKRLLASLDATGGAAERLAWTGALPPGSPSHGEVPYGFKLYAILEAERLGRTSVLWLDSPCVAVAPLGPVFDRIEAAGHLLVSSGNRLGNWASDDCLASLGLTRDFAMGLPLMSGSFIGLDLSKDRPRRWLEEMIRWAGRGLFSGPHLTGHAPDEVRAAKPHRATGRISPDPRCWGHRHDEAVGSGLAHRLGMAIGDSASLSEVELQP